MSRDAQDSTAAVTARAGEIVGNMRTVRYAKLCNVMLCVYVCVCVCVCVCVLCVVLVCMLVCIYMYACM